MAMMGVMVQQAARQLLYTSEDNFFRGSVGFFQDIAKQFFSL